MKLKVGYVRVSNNLQEDFVQKQKEILEEQKVDKLYSDIAPAGQGTDYTRLIEDVKKGIIREIVVVDFHILARPKNIKEKSDMLDFFNEYDVILTIPPRK